MYASIQLAAALAAAQAGGYTPAVAWVAAPVRSRRAVIIRASVTAETRKPHPANAQGNLFVDRTCIDCDTCRYGVHPYSRCGQRHAG